MIVMIIAYCNYFKSSCISILFSLYSRIHHLFKQMAQEVRADYKGTNILAILCRWIRISILSSHPKNRTDLYRREVRGQANNILKIKGIHHSYQYSNRYFCSAQGNKETSLFFVFIVSADKRIPLLSKVVPY